MIDSRTTAEAPRRLCYSIDHTAAALDITRTTVYRLLRGGQLASVRILGKTVIETAEIERFLSANRTQVAQ